MLLKAEKVCFGYGKGILIEDLSFSLKEGDILLIKGPNGTGKTTLLKIILGVLKPIEGKVFYKGNDTSKIPVWKLVNMGVSYMPQEGLCFDSLSINETLKIANVDHERTNNMIKQIKERLTTHGIDKGERKTAVLSGGEKKLLSFLIAVSRDSDLIILDEPCSGLNNKFIEICTQIIREKSLKGTAFIVVEHNPLFLRLIKANKEINLNRRFM
ncbi:ATP-binding cassette domain-containing protein [Hydrogenivirga sp. 128-5-R1-1]|uniref:ATP-binding cassette domain-containing protein n=1 Tax=Hydrogenivirga sp. 128-5-R1-1 TaxID=392423 RepID=UPI00015F339C|nr:ATP-binding cassette domain-containing protein [Hydrogenivirga sp. 128-5-R1-1]EDP74873.1 hypothetical protein HG1285_13432 [Hydrogenivirga sp. 128-5-R1-1]